MDTEWDAVGHDLQYEDRNRLGGLADGDNNFMSAGTHEGAQTRVDLACAVFVAS
jgi:hypothetical protein